MGTFSRFSRVNIGNVVGTLDNIQQINTIQDFQVQKANLVQAVADLKTHLTDQETTINNLNATINQDQVTIANLTTQNNALQQDNIAKQKTIDDLSAKLAAATAAPTAKTLDLASSFRNVLDQIHQQARQQAAGGTATTATNMQVELKTLVTLQGTDTVMVLPTPATPIDPNQLSTLRLSFAHLPVIPPPSTVAPAPAPGPAPQPPSASNLSAPPGAPSSAPGQGAHESIAEKVKSKLLELKDRL